MDWVSPAFYWEHKRSSLVILSYTKSATSHTRSISYVSRRKQDPKG